MIVEFEEIEKLQKEKVVCTAGCFDLFHRGHVDHLRKIKEKFPDHKLAVALLPDKRIEVKKGEGRPVIKQQDRMAVVDAIKFVDFAFLVPVIDEGEGNAIFPTLEKIRPDVVVIAENGYDENFFKKLGAQLVIFEGGEDESTTSIINRIKK